MTEAAVQEGAQTLAEPITLAQLVDQLKPHESRWYEPLTYLGREGVVQSEGEIRRGVVAINGAGLLAVISLLSQSLHTHTVKAAAILYFLGLMFGWLGWSRRALSSRAAFGAQTTFATAFATLQAQPAAHKPMTTVAEVEAAQRAIHALIDGLAEKLKAPGNTVTRWTLLALACFFIATAALVADFELTPRPVTAASGQPPARASSAAPAQR